MTGNETEKLTWSHCIPTVNRSDILEVAVRCSLAQTRLPKQIIVVSASDNWSRDKERISQLCQDKRVELIFEHASARSAALQRNQALSQVTGDIVLFTDDDALLFPDFAEEILSLYEMDAAMSIAGVGGAAVDALPPVAASLLAENGAIAAAETLDRKVTGARRSAFLLRLLQRSGRAWRWCNRELLMMSMESMFVPYDHGRPSATRRAPSAAVREAADLDITDFMPGYAMSARAEVARAEPFNPFLLAYCPLEDLDATYRYGRHGHCVIAHRARLNHYEVAANRLTRKLATALGVSNMALFIHTNSNSPTRHRIKYSIYVLRRLVGEILKDAGSKRFDFPQARGVLTAIPMSIGIFRRSKQSASNWYVKRQQRLLASAR